MEGRGVGGGVEGWGMVCHLTISSTWPSLRLDPPCVLSVSTVNCLELDGS